MFSAFFLAIHRIIRHKTISVIIVLNEFDTCWLLLKQPFSYQTQTHKQRRKKQKSKRNTQSQHTNTHFLKLRWIDNKLKNKTKKKQKNAPSKKFITIVENYNLFIKSDHLISLPIFLWIWSHWLKTKTQTHKYTYTNTFWMMIIKIDEKLTKQKKRM